MIQDIKDIFQRHSRNFKHQFTIDWFEEFSLEINKFKVEQDMLNYRDSRCYRLENILDIMSVDCPDRKYFVALHTILQGLDLRWFDLKK